MKSRTYRILAKWFLCWICLSFSFIFLSNIFMHLFSCQRSNVDKNVFTLQEYENCEIGEDGQYIYTADSDSMKLLYSIDDPSKEISKIHIDFGTPLRDYLWLELYYPDEEGNYPSEYVRKERLVAGLTEHVIDVETGKYQEIRINFTRLVSKKEIFIEKIYAGESEKMMLYADKVWRYRIWGICLLSSFCLSVFLFVWKKSRTLCEKLCRAARSFITSLYASIDIRKLLKVVIGGILVGGALEGIVMRLRSQGFNGKEAFIFFVVGILLLSFFIFRETYTKKLELISLLVFLLLAFAFICVIPISLGTSWDDDTHYYRIISMARACSGTITEADDMFDADVYTAINDEKRFQRDRGKEREYGYNVKYQNGSVFKNTYIFSYKDVAYLPFAVGIWVSYGLGLSFCMTAFIAKVFQILLIGLLIYASMKNLKSGKILLLTFAMVPTVFFLSVSYSYDSWLIFLLIYAFSRYFGELQRKDEKLTFAGFCKIFIPAFLALIPKIVYAPILFLMAYMPKSKWKEKKWRLAYHACFICAALFVVFIIWYAASGRMRIGSGDTRGSLLVNGDLQLQFIINHFDTYCHTLLTFLRSYFSYNSAKEYLTNMSNIGSKDIQYITIALLFAAAVWDRSSLNAKTIPVRSKLAALIMPLIIAAICATTMYLVFTRVGLDTIKGCQGRYLLPAIFPSLFMLSRCKPFTNVRKKIIPTGNSTKVMTRLSVEELGNMILIFLNACFLLYNLWIHCASKY